MSEEQEKRDLSALLWGIMILMSGILLAIKPEYVTQILNGTKRFEFRTRIPTQKVSKIFIYCTSPVMAVVGEAEVKSIISLDPETLWKVTHAYAGISKEGFLKYFSGHKIAFAYELGKATAYKKNKPLSEYGMKGVPQSFVYTS